MKIKRNIFFILLYFFTATILLFSAQTENTTRRFGIFIGSNNGGRERVMLRYAVTDAKSMINVFSEMGGIANKDSVLLVEPTIKEINNRIDAMHEQVLHAAGNNRRTEIVFYYSGHSDEDGLLLNREKYTYRELRDRINSIPSDMRIVILDSCASGAFTRLKGGEKTLPFLMDSSFSAEGYAFLTSSSINEVSQESDKIAASYFTHSLVSGLRGAADSVGDGRVTLNELYRFAYSETISRTETSLYGTQHPSYDIQINGTGDVVLTDINQTSAGIMFDENLTGRLSIRNSRDHLIAEITKSGRPMELGLEPGLYRITLQQGGDLLRTEVTLIEKKRILVTENNFTMINAEPTRSRGEENRHSLPKSNLYTFFFNAIYEPFPFPLIGFVNFGIGNHDILQLGFINWNTKNFSGVQAGFVNTTIGDFIGFQPGFVNTTTGKNFSGFQAGFVNTTTSKDFSGFQAGFINTVTGKDFSGFQAGFVNTIVGDVKGVQASFVNTSTDKIDGMQLGFVNVAPRGIKGYQLGFVNYTDSIEDGIPIGFISVVREGGYKAIEYSFSEFYTYNVEFKIGVEIFYSTIIAAYNQTNEFSYDNFALGFGIGSIIPIGEVFFFNPEANYLSSLFWKNDSINYLSFIPYFGINLGKFSILAGPSVAWAQSTYRKTEIPKPLFYLHSYDIDNYNKIIVAARAVLRLQL